jgi:uncharacterized protein (TIGR02270 family)
MARALPPPQWDLVRESFREAAFLWARWEDALDSPLHTLDDVVRCVERRLVGAVDGVRLGGRRAIDELLIPALSGRRHHEATVAAHILAALSRDEIGHVLAAFMQASGARLAALRRGLECCNAEWPHVLALSLAGLHAEAQAALLDAFAFRRFPLPPGVDGGLARSSTAVQAAGLRLAATVNQPWAIPYIEWGLPRSDPTLHVAAALAGLLRAHPDAPARAQEAISRKSPGSDALLPLFAIARGDRLMPILITRLQAGDTTREVFDALACIGTVTAADACAAVLHRPEQARLAADGLHAITGIDPRPPPKPDEPPPAPREQLLLCAPDPDLMRGAWQELRPRFHAGYRYLGGQPFAPASIPTMLRTLSMRRRNLLSSELTLRSGGAAFVTTRTFSGLQRAQMAAVGA